MRVSLPAEARDSVSRALIVAQGCALAALRARVDELEREIADVRRELALAGLPRIVEAWD